MDGGERREVAMPGSSRELKSTRTRRRKTTPPHQPPNSKSLKGPRLGWLVSVPEGDVLGKGSSNKVAAGGASFVITLCAANLHSAVFGDG
jgi:hypothetical protein